MYLVRVRFRVSVRFGTDATSIPFRWKDRLIELKSQTKDEPLNQTDWLVLIARGFDSSAKADSFGRVLKDSLLFAGMANLYGVDVGYDKSSSWISEDFCRSSGVIRPDENLLQNVHGLMVMPDDGKSKIIVISAKATVSANVENFVKALEECAENPPVNEQFFYNAIRVLNFSLLASDPLAKIVLSFAAVEELGQSEKWSRGQLELIKQLADNANNVDSCSVQERKEVHDAILRSFKLSLRQGAMRLLDFYDLPELKSDWDRLYSFRSKLFHGTISPERSETDANAFETQKLCLKVIARISEKNGFKIPKILLKNIG